MAGCTSGNSSSGASTDRVSAQSTASAISSSGAGGDRIRAKSITGGTTSSGSGADRAPAKLTSSGNTSLGAAVLLGHEDFQDPPSSPGNEDIRNDEDKENQPAAKTPEAAGGHQQDRLSATQLLKLLTEDFKGQVFDHLNKVAKNALATQKEIKDPREFARVKAAIEERIIDLILERGDDTSTHGKPFIAKLRVLLAAKYEYMYNKDPEKKVKDPEKNAEQNAEQNAEENSEENAKKNVVLVRLFSGRGFGGIRGLDGFESQLQEKVRRAASRSRLIGKTPKLSISSARRAGVKKPKAAPKKRMKKVYGVSKAKFYPAGDPDEPGLLEELRGAVTKEDREKVFGRQRSNVQLIFWRRTDSIFTAIPGFFEDPLHIQKHFEALSTTCVARNVEENIDQQMGYLCKVISYWCQGEGFRGRWKDAERMQRQCRGSRIPKFVCLLRELCLLWHEDLGGLIRLEGEPEPVQPNILCREDDSGLVFDVHAERMKIFENLNLNDAISAFFHIGFVGNIRYPAKGEAVAVWLQRKVARVQEEGKF